MTLHGDRFGNFGGRFVAEILWGAFERVDAAFKQFSVDAEFRADRDRWMARIGRPTPLVHLRQLSRQIGGATIWLKRDDLLQGDSYCMTSAVGQVLLAKRAGYSGVSCETVTGEFGVALASVARAQGLDVRVFMGRADYNDEPTTVALLGRLGVKPEIVDTQHRGRSAAWASAMRFWSEHPDTMYCASAAANPAPYPQILDFFNQLSGAELKAQLQRASIVPSYIVASVGSGAYAAGLFTPFIDELDTQLVGVQSADNDFGQGSTGVMFGTKSFVLQDAEGLPVYRDSAAGGLCHNAIGPQHATWADRTQVMYTRVGIERALQAVESLADAEGILINWESGHALAYTLDIARTLEPTDHIVVGVSGSGYRDILREDAE